MGSHTASAVAPATRKRQRGSLHRAPGRLPQPAATQKQMQQAAYLALAAKLRSCELSPTQPPLREAAAAVTCMETAFRAPDP